MKQDKIISLSKGKIPPQAVDLEEAVLGAMMIDTKGVDEVIDMLSYDNFYKQQHKHIFEAINMLVEKREPVDLLTVSSQLKKNATLELAGGEFYLVQLTQKVSSSANIVFHSRIILQHFIKRELIKNSNSIIDDAYDETVDVFDLLDNAYEHLNGVTNFQVSSNEQKPCELISEVIQRGKDIYNGKIKAGIFTPISNLTNKSGGWRNTELIIIAARPGMGKTSFGLSCAYEPSKRGIPTAFFSLEMKKGALVSRLASMEAEIDGNKFNSIGLSEDDVKRIESIMKEIDSSELYIDDTSNATIKYVRIKIKRMIREHGIKFVVIDYLQLMDGEGKNREQQIANISRGLKNIAMEMNIPVMALSQLSRAVESRGGSKRPMLSDLRESGAIEQDADVVGFIYRPEYYMLSNWDDYNGVSCIDEAEYIIAKNRNGGLVRNRMKFKAEYTKFSDIEIKDTKQMAIDENDDDLPF